MIALGSDEVTELSPDGSLRQRLPLAKDVSSSITGFARGSREGIMLEVEGANRLALTEGGAPVSPSSQSISRYQRTGLTVEGSNLAFVTRYTSNDPSRRGAVIEVVGQNGVVQRVPVQVPNGVGMAQAIGVDGQGNTYVLITELFPGHAVRVDRTVRRYYPDGKPGEVARIPVVGRHAPALRDTLVGSDGEVYALLVLADRALVLRLGFADTLSPVAYSPSLTARWDRTSKIGHTEC